LKKKPNQLLTDTLSDEQLFQQAVEGAVPLKKPATTDSKAPRQRLRKKTSKATPEISDDGSSGTLLADLTGSTETDSTHRKNGVKRQTLQKLKRGQFPVQDQFDLHHLHTHAAKTELLKFIDWSQQQNLKCLRIIHGKGLHSEDGPKLKLMTRQVLREHTRVLAFTSCKPSDGGEGATDVLLRS
jgi:DNA-nicking Smr family endonuclease